MEPEPTFFAWSRSRPNLVLGRSRLRDLTTSGAGSSQKSGSSATLIGRMETEAGEGGQFRNTVIYW